MRKLTPLAFVSALVCLASFGFFANSRDAAAAALASANGEIQNVVAGTTAFLNSLTPAQRGNVQFTITAPATAKAAKFSRAGTPGKQSGPGPGGAGGQANGRGADSNMRQADAATQSRPRPGSG